MKKRWIPFIAICLALGFLFGLQNGSAAEVDRMQTRQEIQIFTQTAIAVVNADAGVTIGGEKRNYSAAVIETLGDDYTHVGLAVADKGFEDGAYGAVVVFPSDVSAKIWSFNSRQPEKVKLEFRVNPDLSEKDYLETYVKILELQLSINTTLAYTYVSSIYEQFQSAQDQVDGIFKNDQSDLSALEIVTLKEFTASLDLEELPELPLEPTPADTQSYFLSVAGFAGDVAGRYLDSYSQASGRYLGMREGLFRLTENFSQQENDWLSALYDWTSVSVDYGAALEEYSAAVLEHEDGLLEWYQQNVEWNEALRQYQEDVMNWHEAMQTWYGEAGEWHAEYTVYLEAAEKYMENVETFHSDLLKAVDPVMTQLEAWKIALEQYANTLTGRFNDLINDHNALTSWRTKAMDLKTDLEAWKNKLQPFADDLANLQLQRPDPSDSIYDPADPMYTGDPEQYSKDLAAWCDAVQLRTDQLSSDLSALPPLSNPDELPALTAPPGTDPDDPGGSTPDPPPSYAGDPLPEKEEVEAWKEGFAELDIPAAETDLEPPGEYDGSDAPDEVEEHETMGVEQPENPLVDPPPRPDDFWASLNQMHEQLSGFDVGAYLSDDIKQQVAVLLNSFDVYLGTVRDDLSMQFEGNVMKLLDAQSGYSSYLSDLRADALKAEADEQGILQTTLEEYAAIKERNSTDTQERLSGFAGMMPESRSPAGLNRNLVGFTVAPFEFVPPALRPEAEIIPTAQIPITNTYRDYLWIVLWIAIGVLVLTLLSYALVHYRRKKRGDAE